MKVTAPDLLDLKVIDKIVDEPEGGAHRNPDKAAEIVKSELLNSLAELSEIPVDKLLQMRVDKFSKMGYWNE